VCWQGARFGVCLFLSLGLLKEREARVVSSGIQVVCMCGEGCVFRTFVFLARPS
jgi:hypothetical protein